MQYITFSIWHKLLLICALIKEIHSTSNNVETLVKQYNLTNQAVELINMTLTQKNLDFVHKLQFVLNAEKIIPYLREEVYQNYEKHNITTQDLIDLWELRQQDLRNLTMMLDIPEVLLNLNTFRLILGVSNLTFNHYYEEVRKNITTNSQLKDTLQIFNLDQVKFAGVITYGTEDEVFDVLNEGLYTWDKFEEVTNKTGTDILELTKNLILDQLSSMSIQSVLMHLQKIPIINKNMYDKAWKQTVNSTEDIYRVVNLRRIVDNIHEVLTANIHLGIAISEHEIIMHEQILNNLENMLDVVDIYSESATNHQFYENLTLIKRGNLRNTSKLWSNNSISNKIEIMDRVENGSLSNCSYFDKDISESNVTLVNVTTYTANVTVDDGVVFNLGNPLVCEGKLVGLAVGVDETAGNVFSFDTFFKPGNDSSKNGAKKHLYSFVILLVLTMNSWFRIM